MTYAARLHANLLPTAPGQVHAENIADARERATFLHPADRINEFIQHARLSLAAELIEDAHEVNVALDDWTGPILARESEQDAFVQTLGWGGVFRQYVTDLGDTPTWTSNLYEYAAMDLAAAVAGMIRELAAGLENDEE